MLSRVAPSLAVGLLGLGLAPGARMRPPARHHFQVLSGTVVSQGIGRALSRQSRVEVRGTMFGPAKLQTHYILRYQAEGREYVRQTGGAITHIQVGIRNLITLQAVYIDKTVYTSYDGMHWMHGVRQVAPTPLDVLSLNVANSPCCVSAAHRSFAHVSNLGGAWWGKIPIYRLQYSCASNGYSAHGIALVDQRSFLPLQYTQISSVPRITGTFRLTYGGTFSIVPPRLTP